METQSGLLIHQPVPGLHVLPGPSWPGVSHFCTLRSGGCSKPPWAGLNLAMHVGDAEHDVQANRELLQQALPGPALWLNQVHGSRVLHADECQPVQGREPEADAMVTHNRYQVLAIMTADCLPVVLSDARGRVLGLAHAGWRGLAAGILENTLARLRLMAPEAHGWRAWLGPAIGPAAFEVGPEVRAAFVRPDDGLAACFVARPGSDRWLADLAGLAHMRLLRAGVGEITHSNACTWSRPGQFFSYRRDTCTGRQATVAWLGDS